MSQGVGVFGVGAGDAADPAGLTKHSLDKYLSQTPGEPGEAPPPPQVPADEEGPAEGAVGLGGREPGGHCCRGTPSFTGSMGAGGRAYSTSAG